MPANTLWNIVFGPYAFTVNRTTLTYRLEETTTGTVWADGLSLGSIEIVERETNTTTQYSFGELKLISLSEKSGATGKRILFGLDAPGRIPVDIYLTCTEREIQVTVEASRDTKTHRIGEIRLLPGLCTIPEDNTSYLVIPHQEGVILFARDAPIETLPLRIWEANTGLTMPFVGAVRTGNTALALLTDSAYGVADLSRSDNATATLDLRYERDPERRRLDVRLVLIPGGDHIAIARAYRDKLIGDGGHVSLRKKMRERPELETFFTQSDLNRNNICFIPTDRMTLEGDSSVSRWDAMQQFLQAIQDARQPETPIVGTFLAGDWSAVALDFWEDRSLPQHHSIPWLAVPLMSVVYADAVPIIVPVNVPLPYLLQRAVLCRNLVGDLDKAEEPLRSLFRQLNLLCLSGFLTEHRFLTPDFMVEEARFSNDTRILINRNDTDSYETSAFHLPPFGFCLVHRGLTLSGSFF